MSVLKTLLTLAHPNAEFLSSEINENSTEGSILEMGLKLAQEVNFMINSTFPMGDQLARISFIGHSLGGLIIRAALPYLEKYKFKMHGFMTLCSPHLGYMYKSGNLVSAGMWFLKKWKKSPCLIQLSMQDNKDLE